MSNALYVLDACALLAYLLGEPGGEVLHDLLRDAERNRCRILMHRLNALEVYYNLLRQDGEAPADKAMLLLSSLPVTITGSLDDPLFKEAGRIKAFCRVSLADAVTLALAKVRHALLVTSDHHEFDPLEQAQECSFRWIR